MESRESSIHSLFALDTSHHGGIRIHSASSPPRPLTPLEDAQEQLQQRIRILGQPAAAFESQVTAYNLFPATTKYVECSCAGK